MTFITERGRQGLDPATVWSAAYAILGGLAALHKKGMAHADLKPQNFLLPRADTIEGVKFCDFDGSTFKGVRASGPSALSPCEQHPARVPGGIYELWLPPANVIHIYFLRSQA